MGGYRERDGYRGRESSPGGYRRAGGGGGGYRDDGYGRPEWDRGGRSPERGGRDRYGRGARERSPPRRGPGGSGQVLSFKHFMARQPDNVRPKEAEVMYKEYLIKQLGNAKNVWFKEHSESEEMRQRYDPVRIEEALKVREAEAKASVGEFVGASGSDQAAEGEGMEAQTRLCKYPEAAWAEGRTSKDLKLLHKLVTTLDAEKNIQKNPLFGDMGSLEEVKGAQGDSLLDKLLSYAWRVHGVDYYAGEELGFNRFRERKDSRQQSRGPKPTEAGASAVSDEAAQYFRDLEIRWDTRVFEGDRAFKLVGKEKLEGELSSYVDSQVQQIDGNKFMCKLCTKLFKGSDFTKKHISNKHAELVEQVKAKTVQKIYMDNFLADETFKEHEEEVKALQDSMGEDVSAAALTSREPRAAPTPARTPRRSYFDLDQPKQETRSVLDYGDI